MHDALDIRTAPQRLAGATGAASAHRAGARRLFLREALDDWEIFRDCVLAPA